MIVDKEEFKSRLWAQISYQASLQSGRVVDVSMMFGALIAPLVDMLFEYEYEDKADLSPTADCLMDEMKPVTIDPVFVEDPHSHIRELDAALDLVSQVATSRTSSDNNTETGRALTLIQRCITEFRSQIEEHLDTRGKLRDEVRKLKEMNDTQKRMIHGKMGELHIQKERIETLSDNIVEIGEATGSGYSKPRNIIEWVDTAREELHKHTAVEGGISMDCGHPVQCAYTGKVLIGAGNGCTMCDLEAKIVKLEAGNLGHEEAVRFLLTRRGEGSVTPWQCPVFEPCEDVTTYIVRMTKSVQDWVNGLSE